MAEVSVLPKSHELKRNRGQRTERSCEDRRHAEEEDEGRNAVLAPRHSEEAGEETFEGRSRDPPRDQGADERARQTRGHEEKGEPQEIEVERPRLTKDDIENRHAEANKEIRGDRPPHTTEEGQEDGSSVLASADARPAGKDGNRQREETTDRKSEPSFRQGARRSVQGVLPKDTCSIYFSGAPLDSSHQTSRRARTNIESCGTATPIVRRTAPSRCPFKADGPNATPVH